MKRMLVVFLLVIPSLVAAQQKRVPPKTPDQLRDECKTFVKSFYDWYVPKAATGAQATVRALKEKPQLFSRALVQQLKDDAAAQAANSSEVVGLDGDPFLNCQDCPKKYTMSSPRLEGYRCQTDIAAALEKDAPEVKLVTAEAMYTMNHWIFTNFLWPDGGDLQSTLKKLKEQRGGK